MEAVQVKKEPRTDLEEVSKAEFEMEPFKRFSLSPSSDGTGSPAIGAKPDSLVRPWEHSTPKLPKPTSSLNIQIDRCGDSSPEDRNSSPGQDSPTPSERSSPVVWPSPLSMATSPAPPTSDPSSLLLLHEFCSLLMQPEHAKWAQGLYTWYQYESQRLDAHFGYLLMLAPRGQHKAMQGSHASMHAQLIGHTRMLLHSYVRSTSLQQTTSQPSPPATRDHINSELSDTQSEESQTSLGSDDSAYNSSMSPQVMPTKSQSSNSSSGVFNVSPGNKRSLPSRAVQLMEQWYQANFDHPYPDNALVQHFAEAGGITTHQVKKWMANKRVRSLNTLSYNGSIHPKRLRRMLREREAAQNSQRMSPYPSMSVMVGGSSMIP